MLMPNESLFAITNVKVLIGIQIFVIMSVVIDCICVTIFDSKLPIAVTLVILSPVSILYGCVMKYLKNLIITKVDRSIGSKKIGSGKTPTTTSNLWFINVFKWIVFAFAVLLGLAQMFLGITSFIQKDSYYGDVLIQPDIAFGHVIFLLLISVVSFRNNIQAIRSASSKLIRMSTTTAITTTTTMKSELSQNLSSK